MGELGVGECLSGLVVKLFRCLVSEILSCGFVEFLIFVLLTISETPLSNLKNIHYNFKKNLFAFPFTSNKFKLSLCLYLNLCPNFASIAPCTTCTFHQKIPYFCLPQENRPVDSASAG